MKKTFYFLFIFPQILFAQWHDANWHFGGLPYFNDNPPLKNAIANTLGNSPIFEVTNTYLQNFQNSVTMSDKDGNLLFYCNGMKIYNKAHQLMENGTGINAGATASDPYYIEYGYPIYYTMVCLPIGKERYFLFHSRKIDGCSSFVGADILYTVIDMSANNGLGKVLDKNKEIIGCEFGAWCAISATRHANGQDWWVIVANHDQNRYFRIRLTQEGIADTLIISIDAEFGNWGNGRSVFTPDGSKYIDCRNARSARVYQFDRCDGSFGQYQDIPTFSDIPYGLGIGATTSATSRYLYLCSGLALTQVDLHASNIASTLDTISLHDNFFDESIYFISFIVWLQLMPDGVIYGIRPQYNATRYLHQIKFPNRMGIESTPLLHNIRTPISVSSLPYFPNYRLGPLDGSPCDTLGIDNLPLAHFRWDVEDTLSPLVGTFTDLSYYEPAIWSWDFGDPNSGNANMSQDTSPAHIFSAPGTYNVCLTVCNSNACDTVCKEVKVGLTSTDDEPSGVGGYGWLAWPNPVQDVLNIALEDFSGIAKIQISNIEGKVLVSKQLDFASGQATLSFVGLPQGVYLLRISDETGERYWVQRVVKM